MSVEGKASKMTPSHPHAGGCACPLANLGLHRLDPPPPLLAGLREPRPELTGAALRDLDAFCVSRGFPRPRAPGPLLVSRPPAGRGYWQRLGRRPQLPDRDTKPDNVPVPAPFDVTCQDCGGRGWKQPSMVVGFRPQRCRSCAGTGKVTVR
jgi:hypothetical protein